MDVSMAEVLPDPRILELISNSYYDVKGYINYLAKLLSTVTDDGDREIVKTIRLNEEKHAKLLESIYKVISTKELKELEEEKEITGLVLDGRTIVDEYEKCIFYSLDTVDHYRRIYFSFLNVEIRDMLYEIISDTQNNGVKFTYLYAKYR